MRSVIAQDSRATIARATIARATIARATIARATIARATIARATIARASVLFPLALLLPLTLSACDVQPETARHAFSWRESVRDMRDALLGSCSHNGTLYAVGGRSQYSGVYRLSGGRWRQEAARLDGKRLWACWAGPDEQIIAVGQSGTIFHHSREGWHKAELPEDLQNVTLYSVWGMQDGTAVAVGGGLNGPRDLAVILHYDGQDWTRADASRINTKTLRAVWGSSVDDYWAVGDVGEIAHFDGTGWTNVKSQVSDRLKAVYGTSANEVYAVGGTGRGVILRWNGSSWVLFDEIQDSLNTVWTQANNSLYVGGEDGFLSRYRRGNSLPLVDRKDANRSFPQLRVQSLSGFGSSVFAATSTIETDIDGEWRGAVLGLNRRFGGLVVVDPAPDAGAPPDAQPADAAVSDAGSDDATSDDAG